MGNLPRNPYVIDVSNNSKRLVIVGTQHSYDSLNPLYQEMEQLFYAVSPQVIINEGGDLSKTYSSLNQAIAENSDLGFDKYLADKVGIETVNGNEPQALEFQELAEIYSKEEAIVFYGAERFMLPYVFGEYEGDLKEFYESKFIFNLMEYDKVPLTMEEQKFSYYQHAYEKYFDENLQV